MGRRKRSTRGGSASQLATSEEVRRSSNRWHKKSRNRKGRITPQDLPLVRPGALSDYRIEVRKTSEDNKGDPSYERIVHLKEENSPSSSSGHTNQVSESSIAHRKLSVDYPLMSFSSNNSKISKEHSDYRRVPVSPGKTSHTKSPDRRKSCESGIKWSASKSPKQRESYKSDECSRQGSEPVGKKTFSAPPTPIRDIVRTDKGRVMDRRESSAWESHPHASHFGDQSGMGFGQHSPYPGGHGGVFPGGMRVEQLKDALSELFKVAQLDKSTQDHRRPLHDREPLVRDMKSLPVPDWMRSADFQGNSSRAADASCDYGEGRSPHRKNKVPPGGVAFGSGGHHQDAIQGLRQMIDREKNQPGHHKGSCLPMLEYGGKSPEFHKGHTSKPLSSQERVSRKRPGSPLTDQQYGGKKSSEFHGGGTSKPFSSQDGVSRKRPGSPLTDQRRQRPRLEQEHILVSWTDQRGKSDPLPEERKTKDMIDRERGRSSHHSGSPSPHRRHSKSPSKKYKAVRYDAVPAMNKSHSPQTLSHFGEPSNKAHSFTALKSAGASPRLGKGSSMVNRPTVRFREGDSVANPSCSDSPVTPKQDVTAGRYKWEYFGKESFSEGEEGQFQDTAAMSSFRSDSVDFVPSTKFSHKLDDTTSDIAMGMGPSTAMVGLQPTATPGKVLDPCLSIGRGKNVEQYSTGYGGKVGLASPKGRGYTVPPGRYGNMPVTLGGVKKSASASSNLRDVPVNNLKVLIRGSDKSLGESVALDCEMVGGGRKGSCSMVGRVAVVNHNGHTLLDSMVAPTMPVTDYRTRYSGIRKRDLIGAPPFPSVQSKVVNLTKGKILVGHDIQNDLRVLHLTHPLKSIRDTSNYYFAPFRKIPDKTHSKLKTMFEQQTGGNYTIQTGEHCPVEDARATMMLYQHNKTEWEASLNSTT